jgi:hypothetical protein
MNTSNTTPPEQENQWREEAHQAARLEGITPASGWEYYAFQYGYLEGRKATALDEKKIAEEEKKFGDKHLAIIKEKLNEKGIQMPSEVKVIVGKVLDDFRYFIHYDDDAAFELCKSRYIEKFETTYLNYLNNK